MSSLLSLDIFIPRWPGRPLLRFAVPQRQHGLETLDPILQVVSFLFQLLRTRRQRRIGLPPVDADLLSLVDRGDEQSDLQRQNLDRPEGEADVARDDDPLVQ